MTKPVIHTIPAHDLIEHERYGGALCDCICGPDIEFLEDRIVVIHNSLDGRELGDTTEEDFKTMPEKNT